MTDKYARPKITEDERRRRARTIWTMESATLRRIGAALGIHRITLKEFLARHGFEREPHMTQPGRKAKHRPWTHGPCLTCLVPFPASELGDTTECAVCETLGALHEPEVPSIPKPRSNAGPGDLVWERAEHRKRMRERQAGELDRVVFRTRAGSAYYGGARADQ
jgi:hypothetical protein